MESQQKINRQLILDTALDIIETSGVRDLTQPRIAKACGIRQSHLTYYFPRKADLFAALLDASHRRAEQNRGPTPMSLSDMLAALFLDPTRMRFFLAIVAELNDAPDLQPVLAHHGQGLCDEVARRTGRETGDPQVLSFVDELRGIGLRALMDPLKVDDPHALFCEVARRHGLELPD